MVKKLSKQINLFALVMISSAFVTSIRNLPTLAETGMKMLFFALAAALFFFLPAALTSAELATGWPKAGGIYAWVKEAFGIKWGFIAIWLQWVYMTISVIAMLYFISGSLAYVFAPSLAENRIFLVITQLVVIWFFTFLNLKGLKMSSWISTVGFLGGVLFPGILIIVLGFIYVLQGNPVHLDMSFTASNLFPDIKHISTLVLLVGFMRAFAGVEASSVHANYVNKPQRNYPLAIFIVVIIGIAINVLGSLAVAVVVPANEISLLSGIMEAFHSFFTKFHMLWLVPIMGFLAAIGQMGGASTWMTGPVSGLFATAEEGQLPPFFQKVNKNRAPINLMLTQAVVISVLGSCLLLLPSLNISFWISVALSMMIYVTMYFLMLLSGLVLRFKKPNVKRAYKIPFGKVGISVVTIVGMMAMIFSFIIAIFPPSQLPPDNATAYVSFLLISICIIFALPFIINKCKKPHWKPKNNILQEGEK